MDPFRPLLRLLSPLRTARWWPTARALLILLHLVAVTAVACPAPVRPFNARSWSRSSLQLELRTWAQRLGQVGITVTPLQLQTLSTTVTLQWTEHRKTFVAPFKSWLSAVGAPQGWYMFTGPDREPQRFVLTLSTTSAPLAFLPVFSLGDGVTEPDLVSPGFVGDHRVRRALFQSSWSVNDSVFRNVCGYFDKQIRERRDDVAAVRCSLISRLVEHPAKLGLPRPETVARELTFAADGVSTETREGASPRTTKPKTKSNGKASSSSPSSSTSSSSGGAR